MKIYSTLGLLLFLSLAGCDKRCDTFVGTWESKNYEAYLDIQRENDVYLVTIKEKSGEPSWITTKPYILYYDNGQLRSDKTAFKSIVYDSSRQTIRINGEEEEWRRKMEKNEM